MTNRFKIHKSFFSNNFNKEYCNSFELGDEISEDDNQSKCEYFSKYLNPNSIPENEKKFLNVN